MPWFFSFGCLFTVVRVCWHSARYCLCRLLGEMVWPQGRVEGGYVGVLPPMCLEGARQLVSLEVLWERFLGSRLIPLSVVLSVLLRFNLGINEGCPSTQSIVGYSGRAIMPSLVPQEYCTGFQLALTICYRFSPAVYRSTRSLGIEGEFMSFASAVGWLHLVPCSRFSWPSASILLLSFGPLILYLRHLFVCITFVPFLFSNFRKPVAVFYTLSFRLTCLVHLLPSSLVLLVTSALGFPHLLLRLLLLVINPSLMFGPHSLWVASYPHWPSPVPWLETSAFCPSSKRAYCIPLSMVWE